MNYDTIKLLNLEVINIDLTKSHVYKVNGKLKYTINIDDLLTHSNSKMLRYIFFI